MAAKKKAAKAGAAAVAVKNSPYVQRVVEAFRDASVALREAPNQKKGLSFGRLLLLTVVSGGIALAVSEGLRKKVLDALFGAEEEFEYTSTTSSASSSGTPATAGTSS